jgi:hypothetical protein
MTDEVQDLIYVVDSIAEAAPHLKMAELDRSDGNTISEIIKTAAIAYGGIFFAPAVITAAVAAKPLVAKLFEKGANPKPEEMNLGLSELGDFLNKHAYPIEKARREFIFPPGHPASGKAYRRHPLARNKVSGKEKLFIPAEQYDEILLEEREAELLKLLVELGATKIVISKQQSSSSFRKVEASAGGGAAQLNEVNVAINDQSKSTDHALDAREFELQGKELQPGLFDESDFSWVKFEPSWGALIKARTVGLCTKAALEVRQRSTYSVDRGVSAAVKAQVFSAAVSAQMAKETDEEKAYLVRVEFKPIR